MLYGGVDGGGKSDALVVDALGLQSYRIPYCVRIDFDIKAAGGRQIQIEDPDGNPIELHEAPKKAAT